MMERLFSQGKVGETDAGESTRTITSILSDESVAMDNHVVVTAGIDLADYQKNPVVPWVHDITAPPVAKMTRLEKRGPLLIGDMQFADAETYAFADTVYRLVKGRFLNAVSISWLPIKSERAKEKDRASVGGLNFLQSKLLEVSIVPIPANPNALVTARAAGINLLPLREWAERILDTGEAIAVPRRHIEAVYQETKMSSPIRSPREADWKCGASRNLPIDNSQDWDPEAAAKSVLDACAIDGPKPDLSKARKAFLVYDAANPKDRSSYQLPIARSVDGRLVVHPAAIRNTARAVGAVGIPEGVLAPARAALEHYEAKMPKNVNAPVVEKRGLYEVCALATLLAQAGYIKSYVDIEEEAEGDAASANPANLLSVCQALGKALVEMAVEEVEELLEQFGEIEAGEPADAERAIKDTMTRAGKKLSKADQTELESIHEHCMRTAQMLREHIDGRAAPADANPETDTGDKGGGNNPDKAARTAEERRKRAIELSVKEMLRS